MKNFGNYALKAAYRYYYYNNLIIVIIVEFQIMDR